MKLLSDNIQNWFLSLIQPLIDLLISLKVSPNHLTTFGLFSSLTGSLFFAQGRLFTGGIFILLAGVCDILDGKVARARGGATKFGALYDSVLDRYSEFAMFFGIGFYFIKNGHFITTVCAFLALGGSLMTSYIRARAEGLNKECKVGIMQRPERIVYLGAASLLSVVPFFHHYPLMVVIFTIAVLANITAIRRVIFVYSNTDKGRELLG